MSLFYLLLFAVLMALIGFGAAYFIRRAALKLPPLLNGLLLLFFVLFYPLLIFILPLPYLLPTDYYILLTVAMLGTGVLFVNLESLPSPGARLGGGIVILLLGAGSALFIMIGSLFCDVTTRRWVLDTAQSRVDYLTERNTEAGTRIRVYKSSLRGDHKLLGQGFIAQELDDIQIGPIEQDSCSVLYGHRSIDKKRIEKIKLRICGVQPPTSATGGP